MIKIPVASLLLAVAFALPALAANDPTVQQIYRTAESGQLTQAQRMIDQVLSDHPNSGKAHYVAAELAARAGNTARARSELQKAETLAPGLPFARAQSVLALKGQLDELPRGTLRRSGGPHGFPWGGLLLIGSIIAIVMLLLRRRGTPAVYGAGGPSVAGMPGYPGTGPYGGPGGYAPGAYGPGAYGPSPAGGIGSGIAGGIASGLAVGAGVVAGEALAHRFLDGGTGTAPASLADAGFADALPSNADMGGNDFGITSDPGSWDDGGGGDIGGSDWN